MSSSTSKLWRWLERWSPIALIVGGVGSLTVVAISALEIAMYGERFQVVPEWGISLVVLPSLFATFVGLVGFYPRVAASSRWLARGGGLAAALGVVLLAVGVVGGLVLDLLGVVAFTGGENNPVVLALFFAMIVALLLSFLLLGLASVLTERPSRTVGVLLLIPLVEPISTIVFELVGVDLAGGPLATLGIEGVALIAVGYLLWTGAGPTDRPEPAPDSAA